MRRGFSMAGVTMLLAIASLGQAQTIRVKADVPFSFEAAGKQLDAGTYSVQQLMGDTTGTLLLRNESTGISMKLVTSRVEKLQASLNTKLVFHRYGSDFFLSEVWVEGSDSGQRFATANKEKELAKAQRSDNLSIMAQAK